MRLTPLDERMNADIDALIAKLEAAKTSRTYLQRASLVGKIAEQCQSYEFYWEDRLYSLMDWMYNVASPTQQQDFESLDLAMAYARALGEFVTITGNSMEIVGVFGADSVKNGKCPDGVDYTWMKRRSQWTSVSNN